MLIPISDANDERLHAYRAVGEPALASRDGVFVAEGREVVRRVLRQPGLRVRSLLVSAAGRAALAPELDAVEPGVPVFEAAQGITEAITGFNIHRGCLALVERPAPRAWQDVVTQSGPGPVVVLEQVGNADNVGAVFRNAWALGAGCVLLSPGCVDPLYRKAVRTSMGAVLDVPFATASPWPAAVSWLVHEGVTVLALAPRATTSLRDARREPGIGRGGRVAVLAGHEGQGLSDGALAAASASVAIPMAPGADSLNVGVAVAIALYELGRGEGFDGAVGARALPRPG